MVRKTICRLLVRREGRKIVVLKSDLHRDSETHREMYNTNNT